MRLGLGARVLVVVSPEVLLIVAIVATVSSLFPYLLFSRLPYVFFGGLRRRLRSGAFGLTLWFGALICRIKRGVLLRCVLDRFVGWCLVLLDHRFGVG